MKKIPNRYRMVVFVFFMTVFIGIALSGTLLVINEGFIEGFFQIWMRNFIKMWITVVPVVIVVIPLVNYFTNKLVEKK